MAFDHILRRNVWVLPLALVVAAAFLDARAVGQLVGAVLSPEPAQLALAVSARRPKPARGVEATAHETSAAPLVSRNPFDSETGPLDGPLRASTNEPDAPAPLADPMNAPACEGVKVLIITKADDPDRSFAAFATEAGGAETTVLRRRNGDVGGKKLEFVGHDRVWLRTAHTRCQARLFDPATLVAPAAKPTAASALDPIFARGITKTGPNQFDIDRAVVDLILDHQAELLHLTRVVPEQENGRTVGIRLLGVKEGSLLALLGIENGDRLQQINGFDVASPEKALEAYARLHSADQLTVQVDRRGAMHSLEFHIR